MNRVFFGWWVLLGLLLIYTANNGILLHTLPLFYPELIQEFGWNEEQVTRPASYFFILAAVLTPILGALLDRYSPRIIMAVGIVVVIACLVFYGRISSLGDLTLVYLIAAVGLAGCGLVPNMLILTRWFMKYRGVAVGILLMGSSLGGAIFPLIAREAFVSQGWREASQLLTVVGGIMMVAAIILLVRNRPEDHGLSLDGAESTRSEPSRADDAVTGLTLGDALRKPAFYVLLVATGALWFCIVGVLQHQSIFLGQDLGVDKASLPVIFSVFFWAAMIGKLMFGVLADYFSKTTMLLVSVLNLMAGLLLLRAADGDNPTSLYLFAVVYGVGFSGAFTMIQLVIAEYFAGPSYGKILGVFAMFDSVAGSLGIKYLGTLRVADGSYLPAINHMVGLCVVVAILVLALYRLAPRPAALPTTPSADG
ncbi:MAG: MFS transporter [Xanthomonadales bacterium]|nr:MFS transporter [Xanthomonadales bacterium]